jgi:hypothetical protein
MNDLKIGDKLIEVSYINHPFKRTERIIETYTIFKINLKTYSIKYRGGKCDWKIRKEDVGIRFFTSRRLAYEASINRHIGIIKSKKYDMDGYRNITEEISKLKKLLGEKL